jgi:predicted NBD/HSP70 family sugar kinase
MLVVSHGAHARPAARVLGHVRRAGVVLREDVVESTGLSQATVSRAITELTAVGLLRTRPDMGRIGAVGRPSVPVQLDADGHGVIGVHLGRLVTTVCVADLRGRVLERSEHRTPDSLDDSVALIRSAADDLRSRDSGRLILSGGVVAPWSSLNLPSGDVGQRLGAALGIRVLPFDHITAAAAAEHAMDGQGFGGMTAYVYARDTIGFATAERHGDQTTVTRTSLLTHFPTGSSAPCRCRLTGCLEATASDQAIAQRAEAEGLIDRPDVRRLYESAESGSARATEILRERARVLGRAVAFVRDMLDCDRVVLVGQGFTTYEAGRGHVIEGFEQTTRLSPLDLAFGRYGSDLQEVRPVRWPSCRSTRIRWVWCGGLGGELRSSPHAEFISSAVQDVGRTSREVDESGDRLGPEPGNPPPRKPAQ